MTKPRGLKELLQRDIADAITKPGSPKTKPERVLFVTLEQAKRAEGKAD
jgi:hypothetical protein